MGRAFSWKNKPEEYLAAIKRGDPDVLPGPSEKPRDAAASSTPKPTDERPTDEKPNMPEPDTTLQTIGAEIRKEVLPRAPSRDLFVVDEHDVEGPLLGAERKSGGRQRTVSRRHSCGVSDMPYKHAINESRWARQMSFGDAEEAVLTWDEIADIVDATGDIECFGARADQAGHLGRLIDDIVYNIEPWVEGKLKMVQVLGERYARDGTETQALYQQLTEECQCVGDDSDELVVTQRARLAEGVKELEVLVTRLDYEIDGLGQRVHDVEDGIRNFERQVEDVEKRAEELKLQLETEGWLHCLVRTLTGVVTGPNITRATS